MTLTLHDEWASLELRRATRERRGGYHAGWRCWSCRAFVSGPEAQCGECGECGERHGGVNHEAYATR